MHKSAMQMHAREAHRNEVKPHQCQQCLKSFSSNHQLVQHIRVHTGEKPYKCSYCDRRFKQLSHVQQHTRLHTGERPYKCHIAECGRAFIQLSNLQQHLRNHESQVERSKNRPFHCNICGKGFATESSLRTHTGKHAALLGGPNAQSCPVCHKLFFSGESLMEHMKYTHKDPNASGVASKRRNTHHPCPVCGKHYVNEGSLRKHLACHPEAAQISSSLRMWPCSVCQAVFPHEAGLLTHMEQLRMDPKHQFAAQYVLSRAAAERRERETLLAAASVVVSNPTSTNGHFGNLHIPGAGRHGHPMSLHQHLGSLPPLSSSHSQDQGDGSGTPMTVPTPTPTSPPGDGGEPPLSLSSTPHPTPSESGMSPNGLLTPNPIQQAQQGPSGHHPSHSSTPSPALLLAPPSQPIPTTSEVALRECLRLVTSQAVAMGASAQDEVLRFNQALRMHGDPRLALASLGLNLALGNPAALRHAYSPHQGASGLHHPVHMGGNGVGGMEMSHHHPQHLSQVPPTSSHQAHHPQPQPTQ
ncbi:unnamed protein product [Darwinula stevensoni]|nr:unnamed protein product [Darwinula stevensoni]CAG0885846.1 unnamed protein product [Darwinula stevensoni]